MDYKVLELIVKLPMVEMDECILNPPQLLPPPQHPLERAEIRVQILEPSQVVLMQALPTLVLMLAQAELQLQEQVLRIKASQQLLQHNRQVFASHLRNN